MPALVTDDGRRLVWNEAGSGQPLLCHPGGPGFSAAYFGGLPELAAARQLLLLDPRGTGCSEAPRDAARYDLVDYADDVEAVRRHLELEQLDFLGHSHGGFVGMAWAGAHPERVGRLVLANTTPRFTDAIRQRRSAVMQSYEGEPWFEDAMGALMAHRAGAYETDGELNALLRRAVPFHFARWDDDARATADLMLSSGQSAAALRHFNDRIAGGMDLRPGLSAVNASVLVITGELDAFGEEPGREIADALPHAELVVLQGAGHFMFGESGAREAWAAAILRYLAGDPVAT